MALSFLFQFIWTQKCPKNWYIYYFMNKRIYASKDDIAWTFIADLSSSASPFLCIISYWEENIINRLYLITFRITSDEIN